MLSVSANGQSMQQPTNASEEQVSGQHHSVESAHQHHSLITTASGKKMIAGGIDGAVTPELVPDSVAYNLFFSSVAEPLNGTPAQQSRERAKLARAQLSEADVLAIIPILANFQQSQLAMEQSFKSGAQPPADLDPLRAQLVTASRESMKTALTVEGLARLDALIQVEKRHMAIYPFPTLP